MVYLERGVFIVIKGIAFLVLVLGSITGLTYWGVPLLWRHGSSAALNLAGAMIFFTLLAWYGAFVLLKPTRKGKRQ